MVIVGYGLSFAATLVSILLGAGRILQIMRSTQSKSSESTQNPSPTANRTLVTLNPWSSPQYRDKMIKQARENERAFLQAIQDSRMNSCKSQAIVTKAEYQNLPVAR